MAVAINNKGLLIDYKHLHIFFWFLDHSIKNASFSDRIWLSALGNRFSLCLVYASVPINS